MQPHLVFGLRNGSLLHVADVERGLACECSCPACQEPLVAKKGPKTQHHFAHASGSECAVALETALHIAAKSIFEEHKHITLPPVALVLKGGRRDIPIADMKRYAIDRVALEQRMGNIVPDVVATVGGKPLIVEIRVTHAVDDSKLERIKALGVSAIEVDLSAAPRSFEREALTTFLVDGIANKRWLFNAVVERKRAELFATGTRKQTLHRGLALHVDDCPIPARVWKGKAYANVIDDCLCCEHAIDVGDNMDSILCDGHRGK